jgi:hypothetical protein
VTRHVTLRVTPAAYDAGMQIRNVVIDCAEPQRLAPFWEAATGYARVWSNEYFVVLASSTQAGPNLLLQRVPEPKVAKNRCHMDLLAEGDAETEIQRMVDLGAVRGETLEQGGVRWTVMADPDANEFCITWPSGESPSRT